MNRMLPLKTPLFALLLSALSGLFIADAAAADSFKPDSSGYIRDWVMLAPIALPEGEACADALFREQIKDETALRPKAGDQVKIGGKQLSWRNVTASTNYFDFNATLRTVNDHVAGYIVTYIESETERPDVIMAVASNDQGRIYFNGVDIYAFSEARPLILDGDKGKVTLKKGINVIVFKILNEQNSWQGAMRLLDKSGAPLQGIKIKLSP
jgi:hypothetical protein